MHDPFRTSILSIAAAPPGFRVDVWHYQTPDGGKQTAVERHKFAVIAWAVVTDENGATDTEPVFLYNGKPTTASQYRRMFSDLRPAPGEPKQTVGIHVAEPVGYVAL